MPKRSAETQQLLAALASERQTVALLVMTLRRCERALDALNRVLVQTQTEIRSEIAKAEGRNA